MQQTLNWEYAKENISRNTKPRINWKVFFGMSLTRAIARFKAAGLTPNMTYNTILFEHPELTKEMKRRLRIGIAARYGEMGTAMEEMEKVK